jgi:hypothetical protein
VNVTTSKQTLEQEKPKEYPETATVGETTPSAKPSYTNSPNLPTQVEIPRNSNWADIERAMIIDALVKAKSSAGAEAPYGEKCVNTTYRLPRILRYPS